MMPKRVDVNQREIVRAWREKGATVQILSSLGKGCPDILVGIKGINFLFEIKNGVKAVLTPHEKQFFDSWKGQVGILYKTEDINLYMEEIATM